MLRNLLRRQEGQGMAEYGLIIALVAVVAIVSLLVLGPKVQEIFRKIAGHL